MPSSLRLEHAAAILALVVVLVVLWLTQRRARQQRLRQLASTWGLEPRVDRQGRPYDGRERRDADVDHDRYRVDDHTWDDLDLAQLVESLDRTLTGIGAQTLYRAIRQPGRDAARATRRVAAARVALDDVDARVASQRLLLGFGEVAGWSIPAALWGALPRAPAPVWALRVLAWTLPISIGLAAWLGSVPLVLVASANAVINVGLHFRTTQRHHS
ncbi:MAG: hypothetical protein KC636_01020, partial [Myxococcales bacterium]|nr:hypothetical protein [Myxococcales bacterium]